MTDIVERARALKNKADEVIDNAKQPDQKLAAMANYGDIALSLVPAMGIEIERLRAALSMTRDGVGADDAMRIQNCGK